MANEVIQTSLRGRRLGLTVDDDLIIANSKGVSTTTVTSAQLLALNATAQTVVPAPASGYAIIPTKVAIRKPAGTAYTGVATGEDLVLKYTNASGSQCSSVIETTGFLDQTTEELRVAGFIGSTGTTAGSVEPVAAAAVVLHLLSGEIATGDSDLYVRVWYDIIPTAFS
jgi:hypothetical protein